MTELTLTYLPSVLSLVLIKNSETSSEFKLHIPIDETQKLKILQHAHTLFGMKVTSNSKVALKLPEDKSIKTVQSISDYISRKIEVRENISGLNRDLDTQVREKSQEQPNLVINSKVRSI